MKLFPLCSLVALIALLAIGGCSTTPPRSTPPQTIIYGESVVLTGQEPAHLAFAPAAKSPVNVRSTYIGQSAATIHYEANRDYIFDQRTAGIKRTKNSRIPDFSTNILYGHEDFDHSKFPGYGNGRFLVFVDYAPKDNPAWPMQLSQTNFLPHTLQKLRKGQNLTLVAFGDSITAGGETTRPDLIYWQRWANGLKTKYPGAKITAVNGATGGDTTANGLARLEDKVLKQNPDLVLVAFGMNDHNIAGFGVPVEVFAQNLRVIVDRIHSRTSAEVVLISTFPPNPKWHFSTHNMEAYALATERVAQEKQCAYADVYHNWTIFSRKKKPSDLLGNNINHPDDFGHWIYFQVLNGLGL